MATLVHNDLTNAIIGGAIEVHRYWGPGLSESVYEKSLAYELTQRGFSVESQVSIPLIYKEVKVGDDLRIDLWVDRRIIVELKSVAHVLPVHESQLMTYMRLTESRVGLLLNFHEERLKDGIIRRVL